MSHWLDDLASTLASDQISRRVALRRTLKTGLAAAALSVFGGCGTTTPPSTTCSISYSSSHRTSVVATQDNFHNQMVGLQRTTVRTATEVMTSGVITSAGATTLQLQTTRSAGGVQYQVRFGSGFHGVQQLTLSTPDGKAYRGDIDGRALVPFSAGAKDIRFADGGSSPIITVDDGVSDAITRIVDKSKREEKAACANVLPTPTAAPRHTAQSHSAAGVMEGTRSRNTPGAEQAAFDIKPGDQCFDLGYDCADTGRPNCESCQGECEGGFFYCGLAAVLAGAAASTEGAAAPAVAGQFVVSGGGCLKAVFDCSSTCNAPGGDCCPVQCVVNGPCCGQGTKCCGTSQCCDQDQECCGPAGCCPHGWFCGDPTAGRCCPVGVDWCGDTCCEVDTPSCARPGANGLQICCVAGHGPACGAICCAPGQECYGTQCCTPGKMCGTTCCDGPTDVCLQGQCCSPNPPPGGPRTCGAVCCPPLSPCCNNVCCDVNSTCLNGHCCPQTAVCGGICCPPGEHCQDPNTGACASCNHFTVPVECHNETGPLTGGCCLPGVQCCAGTCCDYGQTCCAPNGPGSFGCYNETICNR
jgi:hypothetical protein